LKPVVSMSMDTMDCIIEQVYHKPGPSSHLHSLVPPARADVRQVQVLRGVKRRSNFHHSPGIALVPFGQAPTSR
ncbi:MAG TPA: hypothetical protein VJ022_00160, partial [Anaerolineales bacterium]|nr:hypothetical protein [Anaerolineales bacterium]